MIEAKVNKGQVTLRIEGRGDDILTETALLTSRIMVGAQMPDVVVNCIFDITREILNEERGELHASVADRS